MDTDYLSNSRQLIFVLEVRSTVICGGRETQPSRLHVDGLNRMDYSDRTEAQLSQLVATGRTSVTQARTGGENAMAIADRMSQIDCSVAAGLFSSRVIREFAKIGRSKTFADLVHESRIDSVIELDTPIKSVFEAVFELISKKHRTEHVYKTVVAQRILLGRHSLNTAVMMSEFRVATNIADLVILNGTATAYEIKTDLDKLDRLSSQVESYLKVFARVCVLCADSHRNAVLELIPSEVGLLCLTRRRSISSLREPVDDPSRIDPNRVLEVLRIHEALMVLQSLNRVAPEVPNTRMYATLQEIFNDLKPSQVHAAMVQVLRTTRQQRDMSGFLKLLPISLHALTLSISMTQLERERLVTALEFPLVESLVWS